MTITLTMNYLVRRGNRSLLYVLLILAIVYFPFAGKAFTVDDTLFIKAAQQILINPLDFLYAQYHWLVLI